LTGESFRQLLQSFAHTAFRLEGRDRYNSPREVQPLRKFLAGEPDDLAWLGRWTATVRKATAEGRRLSRMHYDEADRFLGAEVIEDPPTVAAHRAWREMAWQRAVRLDDFATR
jgi:hypothetical protein